MNAPTKRSQQPRTFLFFFVLCMATPVAAEEASWLFSGDDARHALFGAAAEGAGEFSRIVGQCRPIGLQLGFSAKAMGQLVAAEAYPIVRFKFDDERRDVVVDAVIFNEADGWSVKLSELDKNFFEHMSSAKQVSIELLAAQSPAGDKTLDSFRTVPERGRKETLSRVAKECF